MISIVIATSGRPQMFDAMMKSLRDTTRGFDVEEVVVVDSDQETMHIAIDWDVGVLDYSSKRRGALNAWNKALFLCDGDIIVPAGDDQIFYPHWLEYALESHEQKLDGYGMVGMNDLAYNGDTQLATMWIFDRKYCKDAMGGILAPPVYKYYCVDSEWNAKAKSLGRFYWDERSIVEHVHSAHGKRPVDATDGFKDDVWMKADNDVFEKRKAEGFPITWQPII